MTMLDERLRSLGDALDLDADGGLPDAVLARLDEPPATTGRPLLRVAAAVLIVLALAAVAVPSSRRTVADWFGFDGVRLERRPGSPSVSVPDPIGPGPDTGDADHIVDDAGSDDPDSGDDAGPPDASEPSVSIGTVVEVGDDEILLSEFVGTLDSPAIGKIVGDGTAVRQVEVGGAQGVWIDGAPHEVVFFDQQGAVVLERFAGNTLLWQDGSVIRRLEGFTEVDAAIEYAEQLGT